MRLYPSSAEKLANGKDDEQSLASNYSKLVQARDTLRSCYKIVEENVDHLASIMKLMLVEKKSSPLANVSISMIFHIFLHCRKLLMAMSMTD